MTPGAAGAAADEAVFLAAPEADADPVRTRRELRRLRRGMAPGDVLVVGPLAPDGPAPGLAADLRAAGFAVEGEDVGCLVARALPAPPGALAVASWTTPPDVRLDLRYASDEAALLDPSPEAVWEELVRSTPDAGAGIVAGYAVDDPYGGERGAPVLARFFGVPLAPAQVTFGAGVTSLLHSLAPLADGGTILSPALTHPDLAAWALPLGSTLRQLPAAPSPAQLVAALEVERPALLHLDRPDFVGWHLELDELEEVVRAASRVGTVVMIDESPAPYLGPAGSAARLVGRADNLVVLRGFTKAYSLGGLRTAYAVASEGVAADVRERVPPLQVGELALHAGLRLLDAGDVFDRLRARVRAVKPAVAALLETAGVEVLRNHPDLPWLGVRDPGGAASDLLERRGIHALRPAPAPVVPALDTEVLRLTLPLSEERLSLFRDLLTSGEPR